MNNQVREQMKNLFSQEATQRTENISAEVWHVEKDVEQDSYKNHCIQNKWSQITEISFTTKQSASQITRTDFCTYHM